MKKILYFLPLLFVMISCEDVIDVDLPPTESRLVVNGVLRVDVTEEFIPVEIKVTETSDFFSGNEPTELESAIIIYGTPNPDAPEILDLSPGNGGTSSLAEVNPGSGIYIPDPTFDEDQRIGIEFARPGIVFILIIEREGRRFAARTTFAPSIPIDNIEQGTETLFDDDETEVIITVTDNPDQENFYVFDFDFGEFLALDDQFIDGQEFQFSYFYDNELEPGDTAEISILGADREFFNYIDLIVEQTEDNGGVFETPAATVRGNVFDVTDLDNIDVFDNVDQPELFALGYFAVVQEFKESITIE